MIDGKFDVVFRGQIVKSFELADVKANLMKLFKSSPEAVERLFGGIEVIIRKDLDYAGAMKYQSALKASGALALIKEQVDAQPQPAQSKPAQFQAKTTKAQFNQPESDLPKPAAQPRADFSGQPKQAEKQEQPTQDANESSDGLSIAAVGAQIMPTKVIENKEVDTSELSLATVGERILPQKVYEKRDIDTSGLSLDD